MTHAVTPFTRQKLLEAAMRVFAESGFRGATTRKIAEAAGVNEVTLFRQFKSKTALINEVAELYARRRSEEALPTDPVSPLQELTEWCDAHLTLLRNSRNMIRKCMAEVDLYPQMAGCMRRGPDVVHRQLRAYTEKLAKQQGLDLKADEIRIACLMLQGSLFAETMGRDIMPDMYPPQRRAGEWYARMFLRMLGVDDRAERETDRAQDRKQVRRLQAGPRHRNGQGRRRPRSA